jgi:hypothetical protein
MSNSEQNHQGRAFSARLFSLQLMVLKRVPSIHHRAADAALAVGDLIVRTQFGKLKKASRKPT